MNTTRRNIQDTRQLSSSSLNAIQPLTSAAASTSTGSGGGGGGSGGASASTSSNAPFWKLSSGKNGEKYLIFPKGNKNRAIASSSENLINDDSNPVQIKTYKLRWFILLVICLANISNAINWICYSAIADFTGKFYGIGYNSVNFLSLVYLIVTIPAGLISFLIIDYFGIRSSVNLACWLNFVGAIIRALSSVDEADGSILVPQSYKFTVLMTGQVLCALAQPFIMFVTTKFANSWFKEDQRALANTVALSSNTFGVLIGAFISPLIVKSDTTYTSEMSLLNFITSGIAVLPAVMAGFITRSTPPTPPSYSAMANNLSSSTNGSELLINSEDTENLTFRERFRIYTQQIKKLFKSIHFIILLLSFGLGLGLFNAITTLIEQILCVRGYTDDDAGLFGGIMILCGIFGSLVAGIVLDKTKRFEETAKICFCLSSVANIFFAIIQNYDNDQSTIRYLLIISFCLIGTFGLPLLPVCMEMSVECCYPIPEATTTGLLFIAGQAVGVVMILIYPKVGDPVPIDSHAYAIQTCISNSTSAASLQVVDYKYPIYTQTVVFVVVSILFTLFFKCPYLRLRTEQERLAEQILNSSRQPNLS